MLLPEDTTTLPTANPAASPRPPPVGPWPPGIPALSQEVALCDRLVRGLYGWVMESSGALPWQEKWCSPGGIYETTPSRDHHSPFGPATKREWGAPGCGTQGFHL